MRERPKNIYPIVQFEFLNSDYPTDKSKLLQIRSHMRVRNEQGTYYLYSIAINHVYFEGEEIQTINGLQERMYNEFCKSHLFKVTSTSRAVKDPIQLDDLAIRNLQIENYSVIEI